MKHDKITKADLKKKSEELNISFPNLLAGYVLEEIMCYVAESEFSENLWLKANDAFHIGHYRREQYFRLDFVYYLEEKTLRTQKQIPGQRLSEELVERMLSSIFVREAFNGIRWKYHVTWSEEEILAEVTAEFEEMKVPVEVSVSVLNIKGISAEDMEFEPLFHGGQKVTYKHFPLEVILMEQLIQVVQYMELLPDMSPYYVIYRIISKEIIDGRRMQEAIIELCRKKKIEFTKDRGEMLSDYQDYPYMRKRWEKYAKSLKKEGPFSSGDIPDWKELSKRVFRFFLPIWNATARDEIFFGDWMPELGRYLD